MLLFLIKIDEDNNCSISGEEKLVDSIKGGTIHDFFHSIAFFHNEKFHEMLEDKRELIKQLKPGC